MHGSIESLRELQCAKVLPKAVPEKALAFAQKGLPVTRIQDSAGRSNTSSSHLRRIFVDSWDAFLNSGTIKPKG